jgi:uncharacterized cupredoxin-like copper-binding protein/plastocyanin
MPFYLMEAAMHVCSPWSRAVPGLFVIWLIVAACGAASQPVTDEAAEAAAEAHIIPIQGMDFVFAAPSTVPSGWVTLEFENYGSEPHHLVVMRLEGGHTVDDVNAALAEHRPLTGIATAQGGPNAPGPGGRSNATLYLEPGEYVLVCVIPSPDGVPHFAKGMVSALTVTEERSAAGRPVADVEINMVDYAYELSTPVTAGRRTIRVVTDAEATEPHDILLIRFNEGKTMADFGRWMATMEGPPPAQFLGGATVMDPGHEMYMTADFEPGEYALICPVPSPDGKRHAEKGMVHLFTVD